LLIRFIYPNPMPCTKDQVIAAINSYASARATGDGPLINMAAAALGQIVDTLTFSEPAPEVKEDGGQE
jgi:hypothetical protein